MSDRHEWLPVARFEFARVVRRGDFIVMLLILPLVIVGISFGAGYLARRAADRPTWLVLVSASPQVSTQTAPFDSIRGVKWVARTGTAASPESLAHAVSTKALDGALIVPPGFAKGDSVRLIVRRSDPGWLRRLFPPLEVAARRTRALEAGAVAGQLADLEEPVAIAQRPTEPESGSERSDRIASLILAGLLIASIYSTAAYLAVGISGEKQARVTEVIVSAIRPQAWMDGKLAAFTAIGLLQAFVWAGTMILIAVFLAWRLPPLPDPMLLFLNLAFLVLGFAFFVALFAAILATIKDLQSTSKIQAYLYFIPVVPFLFLEPILDHPESTFATILSWIPFFSPVLMPLRLGLGAASAWEGVGALVLLALATHLMRLAAGHAFRIGMLMYGKEVSLPEIVRWARTE